MNTPQIQVFTHELFGQIRISCDEGKEWFCLSDVCKALEITNPRDVKKRLLQRGVVTIDTPTYNQHGTKERITTKVTGKGQRYFIDGFVSGRFKYVNGEM